MSCCSTCSCDPPWEQVVCPSWDLALLRVATGHREAAYGLRNRLLTERDQRVADATAALAAKAPPADVLVELVGALCSVPLPQLSDSAIDTLVAAWSEGHVGAENAPLASRVLSRHNNLALRQKVEAWASESFRRPRAFVASVLDRRRELRVLLATGQVRRGMRTSDVTRILGEPSGVRDSRGLTWDLTNDSPQVRLNIGFFEDVAIEIWVEPPLGPDPWCDPGPASP
jgi:hypothetical protein